MSTRYLQLSQVGFYFSLGTPYNPEVDYENDRAYFQACADAVNDALRALPCWQQTPDEAADPMQIAPYAVCDFDQEFEAIDGEMAGSFWVQSERVALFPKDDVIAMRDAVASVMAAKFVRARSHTEYRETNHNDIDL